MDFLQRCRADAAHVTSDNLVSQPCELIIKIHLRWTDMSECGPGCAQSMSMPASGMCSSMNVHRSSTAYGWVAKFETHPVPRLQRKRLVQSLRMHLERSRSGEYEVVCLAKAVSLLAYAQADDKPKGLSSCSNHCHWACLST